MSYAAARTPVIEVLTSRDQLTALEPQWNALVAGSRAPNIFMTWEWVTTWLALVAETDELRVALARDAKSGDLVGFVPFVLRARPASGPACWRELVLAGTTVTAPDHLDCVAKPGWETLVADAVREWLTSPRPARSWDIVRLDGITPDSALARGVLEASPRWATAAWHIVCPYVPLPRTWEIFENGLATNFRRNLRRRLRKLEAEGGAPVSFETADDPEAARHGLRQLFRLHQEVRERTGGGGAFDTDDKRRFYEEVATRFVERGWLRLHSLRVGDRALAVALCFHFGGKSWYYQTGYDAAWHAYGPGYLITRHAIQCAIKDQAHELDLLRGEHSYKYEWNAKRRSVLKLRVAATVAGRVVAPATLWLRTAKHRFKEWRRLASY
jgi:CelD/BcsL family acetyltransferase involved in cellulose biosynthesis